MFSQRFILTEGGDDTRCAQESLLQEIAQRQFDASCCFAIRLALEEALSNAFKHGNKNDPEKVVTLDCRIEGATIELAVRDEGEGFDPEVVPDPTELENLEIPSGRGIVLMRSFMSEVRFEPPGNLVRMTFTRPDNDSPAAG